jgi:hypothetical protein
MKAAAEQFAAIVALQLVTGCASPDPSPPWRGGAPILAVDKIDLLFMIDNSSAMGDKQSLLAEAVPDMVTRLVQPLCLDPRGSSMGGSDPSGKCPVGSKAEFPPVHDIHIGIVTSSLGGRGGDICQPTTMNPANTSLNAHQDDRGELINRGGANETIMPDAEPSHFLSWFPAVPQNAPPTPSPPTPAIGTVSTLIGDFTSMIQGVHEHGCGFEAQNEAWYRFLIQPDPFDTIRIVPSGNPQKATLVSVDTTILRQRHDFLRPDSLVAVIVVTDENEEAIDPLTVDGQGYAFARMNFPESPNGQAPQGTIECAQPVDPANATKTGPYGKNCTSCAFIPRDSAFDARCPQDGVTGVNGYLDPANDPLNLRFFRQKRRFGVFAGYPISRYVRGLTHTTVPDRTHEHDANGNYWGDQDANANCVNPLFAQNLPTDTNHELCALTRSARTPDLIYYAAIAGVPHQLLQEDPTNPDSPLKDIATFSTSDWNKIQGGVDPEHYDFRGADFHMIESSAPRTSGNLPPGVVNSSTCDVTAADNCDPINGREWATKKEDLEFSCIFPLATQKDCTQPQFAGVCDCEMDAMFTSPRVHTQLCDQSVPTNQINAKAYPSVREMEIAHAMAEQGKGQGIVSSVCPIHVTEQAPGDPLYGYRPAVNAIIDRLKQSLTRGSQQALAPDAHAS